jgi:replication factor C subunit 3/5
VQKESGFALVDILRELHPFLFSIELPAGVHRDLLSKLADVEHNLSVGTNPALQLGAVVGAFTTARLATVQAG